MKKNLTPEAILTEIKKSEEKYPDNEVISILKSNIDHLVLTVQER